MWRSLTHELSNLSIVKPSPPSVIKRGRVLIIHEARKTGGVGAETAARIVESEAFDSLDVPIRRLAGLDIPIPYNRTMERHAVPQVDNIVTAVKELMP
jgi:pyruvate/2-oxoglutarate/acetoin dehydrogenase E1 component